MRSRRTASSLAPSGFAVALLVISAPLVSWSRAEAQEGWLTGSPQKRVLELQRTRIDLTSELEELKRAEQLFEEGLISESDVERARAKADKARLSYQEAMLELAVVPPRLSVQRAVKREGPGGERFVTLTLVNLTAGPSPSEPTADPVFPGLQELVEFSRRPIRDIFVSLRDTGATSSGNPSPLRGATVALPYERYVPELAFGESRDLEFQLLRDVSSVLVHIDASGVEQEIDIHLEHAAGGQAVTLVSNPSSQEIDLGTMGTFRLQFSRSSIDERSFGLQVVNLPPQVRASLVDPANGARLSQISFPAGIQERVLELRVTVPERTDERVQVNTPLEFWLAALEPEAGEPFGRGVVHGEEAIREASAGAVQLEVVPRGVGRLEIQSTSLFSEIGGQAEPLTVRLGLRNQGTRTLHNVRLLGEAPLEWELEWQPNVIPVLPPQEEAEVELKVQIPEEAAVGDYEVKLQAQSLTEGRTTSAPEKIYRVRIQAGSNLLPTVLLISLLLTLTAGIVVFGVRVTRR